MRVRSSICSPRHCRVNVDVGAEKIPVESDFRVTSDAKALGEHESAGDVIGAAVFDEVFTLLGGIVSRLRVGLGTITVALPTDASLQLRCRVAWASERTRQRGGEAGDDGRVHGDECSPPAGESPRQAFPGTGDGGNGSVP